MITKNIRVTATQPSLGVNFRELFWALMASGQIVMRKVDGWQSLAEKPPIKSLTLLLDRIASCSLETRQQISTHSAPGPVILRTSGGPRPLMISTDSRPSAP